MAPASPVGTKRLRGFGLGAGAILLALALWLRFHGRPTPLVAGLLILSALFLLLGALAPTWLSPVFRGWMAFGGFLGRMNTALILTLTFLLILTPLGLIMRLFKRDPMARRIEGATYWRKPRTHSRADKHFERQF
jgi:saxitoxin biosynthesis operon SxtJ-like protein